MSPWSTRVERDEDGVRLELLLSTDVGPARTFKPFLEVTLDETSAIILFGELGLALQAISEATPDPVSNVLPFPSKDHP